MGEEPDVRGFFFPKEIRASKDYVNQGGRLLFSYTIILVIPVVGEGRGREGGWIVEQEGVLVDADG